VGRRKVSPVPVTGHLRGGERQATQLCRAACDGSSHGESYLTPDASVTTWRLPSASLAIQNGPAQQRLLFCRFSSAIFSCFVARCTYIHDVSFRISIFIFCFI
jgi:hypothetical protein